MTRYAPVLCALALLLASPPPRAYADADTEARLRDALRNAILQQRAAEDERAVLAAKQSESSKQIETLRAQVDELTKGGSVSKKNEAEIGELNRRLSVQGGEITQLNQTLEKSKTAYNEAVSVARTKEAERTKLATDVDGLTQRATGCETKNAELFKIGNEILGRLEKMGLGDVFGAREPFIGLKRVELQNIVQDEGDKLLDQKVAQ